MNEKPDHHENLLKLRAAKVAEWNAIEDARARVRRELRALDVLINAAAPTKSPNQAQ